MDALAPAESEVAMRDCPAHMAALYRSAKVPMVAGVATEARSVQRRAGEIVFSDGTAEEMIGCVFLLEAGSLDEARASRRCTRPRKSRRAKIWAGDSKSAQCTFTRSPRV